MERALGALKQGGIDKPLAVALVALSEGETGVVWATKRPHGEDICCGQVVGLEAGLLDGALRKDADAAKWLAYRGWIAQSGEGKLIPAGGFGNPLKPQKNAYWMEYLLANGKKDLLTTVSIGPTQMHMGQLGTGRCGFPQTMAELYAFYSTVQTGGDGHEALLVRNWLRYLAPKGGSVDGCLPANVPLADGTPQRSIAWLTSHAGNAAMAQRVYYGDPSLGARPAYKDSYAKAAHAASNIGW